MIKFFKKFYTRKKDIEALELRISAVECKISALNNK